MDKRDETWSDGTDVPAIKPGSSIEFIIAVRRAHTGKVYSFAASYLNAYPLRYEWGCPKGKEEFCEGCEDGCPTTGWFTETGDDDGTHFQNLELSEGDKLMGWRNVPQWPESNVT